MGYLILTSKVSQEAIDSNTEGTEWIRLPDSRISLSYVQMHGVCEVCYKHHGIYIASCINNSKSDGQVIHACCHVLLECHRHQLILANQMPRPHLLNSSHRWVWWIMSQLFWKTEQFCHVTTAHHKVPNQLTKDTKLVTSLFTAFTKQPPMPKLESAIKVVL